MTIYRSALINRRPGLDRAAFRTHWIDVHGALAARLPGLGSYRQNHIAERFLEDPDAPVQSIDGVSQLSFDSVQAMEASDRSPEYALCKEDIPKFQGGITILVLEAHELKAAPAGRSQGAKLLWLSARRPGVAAEGLQQRWLAKPHLPAVPGLQRCVQNFVVDRSHPVQAGVPAGDASFVESVGEAWFDSVEALRAAVSSEAGRALLHGDPALAPFAIYRIEEIRIA
ncbi:EthD family reductase [Xenophilus arseniciresistens]|uniref:EthD family reductase n=1 Tax=Xenophilus arseniciresistens TaxID=1283306 RepID=A0AAE3T2L7_9BURK|nr:EthD family reductase [Xenophilus arseniciresistens]MDA7419196.1 EthD family reductase [Xenophilus arseniciresistens]